MNSTGFKDAAKLKDARMLAESFSKKGKTETFAKGAKPKAPKPGIAANPAKVSHAQEQRAKHIVPPSKILNTRTFHNNAKLPAYQRAKYQGAYGIPTVGAARPARLQNSRQPAASPPVWNITSDVPGVLGSKGLDFLRRVEVTKENNPRKPALSTTLLYHKLILKYIIASEPKPAKAQSAIAPATYKFDVMPTQPPLPPEVPKLAEQPAKPSIMDMFNLEMQMELLALNSSPDEASGPDAGRAVNAFSNQLELVLATEASNDCKAVEGSIDTPVCKCSRILPPVKQGLAHSRFARSDSHPISSDGKFTFNPPVKVHDANCPLRDNGTAFTLRPEAKAFVSCELNSPEDIS